MFRKLRNQLLVAALSVSLLSLAPLSTLAQKASPVAPREEQVRAMIAKAYDLYKSDTSGKNADYIPARQEITASYGEGEVLPVQMHDGSQILLHKLDRDYDPTHRGRAFEYLRSKLRQGEHVTGLIFLSQDPRPDMHEMMGTTDVPLNQIPYEKLHPGAAGLASLLKRYG